MPITVDVRHNLNRLEAELGLYPNELRRAAVRALNRTITTVRAEASRSMQKEYPGLRIGPIKRQMVLKRATFNAPIAVITFSHKRFRLFGNFASRQTARGVPLRRLPWRIETLEGETVQPAELAHAFIQRSRRTGVPNVWIRTSLVKQRYPITALLAPSLASTFVERHLGDKLVAIGHARFNAVLLQERRFSLRIRPDLVRRFPGIQL